VTSAEQKFGYHQPLDIPLDGDIPPR